MVQLITGAKGSGKTKLMIELVNSAAVTSNGAVICLEHGQKLTYDIHHAVRLIDTIPYEIKSYQVLRGFITGLYAGNYDITHIFINSLTKITNNIDMADCERFFLWCDRFGEANNITFIISVSASVDDLTENLKTYLFKKD